MLGKSVTEKQEKWYLFEGSEEGISLFLKLFIYFNWKLITLQYCSGFPIH